MLYDPYPAAAGKTILLIEADLDLLDLLVQVLKNVGYHVVPATMQMALTVDRLDMIDLVICDAVHDPHECLRIIQTLRMHTAHATLPIVVIGDEDVLPATAPGINAFISHPFRMRQLLATVAHTLNPRVVPYQFVGAATAMREAVARS